jgi:hypothetical protein
MLEKPFLDGVMTYVIRIDQRNQGVDIQQRCHKLRLGFQKILNGLGSNRLGSRPAWKGRNCTTARSDSPRGLKSVANQIGDHPAKALLPLLSEMFGKTQDVFIQIDGRPHGSDDSSMML